MLEQWEARLQSWEEALHHVSLTPARAREIAAGWAAHLANGAELDQGGMASPAFDLLVTVADPAVVPRVVVAGSRPQRRPKRCRLAGIAAHARGRSPPAHG